MLHSIKAQQYLAAVVIVAAVASCAAAETAGSSAAELPAAYARLDAAELPAGDLRAEYERLSEGFASAAPGWRPEPPATGSLIFIAADQYTEAGEQGERFREVRRQQADALFALARRAAQAGQPSLAFQWATEAVRENPDHAEARRVLGYEQRDGRWLTGYAARMADAGRTWHPQFGWIAPHDLPRYEAGERLSAGRWFSAEADAARRSDIQNGWSVRTDRFLVTTNHSLEAAAELAARLERLYQVWQQLFAGFHWSEREIGLLFAGERNARSQSRPFRVFYHRDQQEYAAALQRWQPRVGETLGIYFDTRREAHFFAGDAQHMGTLYHEAVHQLFQESKSASRKVGHEANFWIVEGVATYFETLTEHADPAAGLYYTVGEANAGRLPAARQRLAEGYYVPLAELTRLGKDPLQRRPDLAPLYSQSAGLAAFLIDGQRGRYREPLVRYLAQVYAGRDHNDTLSEAAGASYQQLDQQYRRFLESLP